MKSLHFAYGSVDGVDAITEPDSIIVPGFGNLYDPAFQRARERGVKVYSYRKPISLNDDARNPNEIAFYMGDPSQVPLWGPNRRNNNYSHLIDIRPGSTWCRWLADEHLPAMIAEGKTDGMFLDVLGARPWGRPKEGETWQRWEDWPVTEQQEWTESAVALMRQLHTRRMELKPDFDLVVNNVWSLPRKHPACEIAETGNQYCNGVCLENPVLGDDGLPGAFHLNYAQRTFGADPRRLLVIAQNARVGAYWAMQLGPTHLAVIDQSRGHDYMHVVPSLPEQVAALGTASAPDPRVAALEAEILALQDDIERAQQTGAALATENESLQAQRDTATAAASVAQAQLAKASTGLRSLNEALA